MASEKGRSTPLYHLTFTQKTSLPLCRKENKLIVLIVLERPEVYNTSTIAAINFAIRL